MRLINRFSLVVLLGTFALNSFSMDIFNQSIDTVYMNSDGRALIKVPGYTGWMKLGTFSNTGSEYLNAMYSLAVAAKMSGNSSVWIRYNDVEGDYPQITILSVD